MNNNGSRRLLHSFKSAIALGLHAIETDDSRVVYSGAVYTSFE